MPKHDTAEDPWTPVDRWEVAIDRVMINDQHAPLRRLVVVTDAGVGKTTNLRWICSVLCGEGSDKLAFCLSLADLVPSGAVGPDWDQVVRAKLLSLMRQALGGEAERLADDMARTLFERLLAAGRIVLCLDALDQMPVHSPALDALTHLLKHRAWDSCRIILSARPYGLDRHWDDLFEDGKHGWRFVQLDEFNEDQQRQFLGRAPGAHRDRLDMILDVVKEDAKHILTVPRVLEMIRQLPVKDLVGLKTPSDVYWRAVCHLVDKGLADREARMLGAPVGSREPARLGDARQTALKLLAASAFQMVATRVPLEREVKHKVRGRSIWLEWHRLAVGEHVPNFDRVDTGQFDEFCELVFERVEKPQYRDNYLHFQQDLSRLKAMNTFLSHGLLDVGELDQWQFRNRSLQEFLAALWMARHCTDDDSEEVREWLYRSEDPLSEEYYWVWRFATEMPVAPRIDLAWIRAMQPVYAPGDGTSKDTVRATEMIWRSWDAMQTYAQPEREKRRNVSRPTREPLSTPSGAGRLTAAERAHDTIVRFQSEDAALLATRDPDAAPDVVYVTTMSMSRPPRPTPVGLRIEFVAIPGRDYVMGRDPVTNAQYELFDPGHQRNGSSPDDDSPVVDVSWYDAWVFARWCGIGYRLPTEEEWEHACRAGSTTDFCYGDDKELWELEMYAWYEANSEGRAHPVGQKLPNAWGLYDMHGNVWEWCQDWLLAWARVVRGGCWDYGGGICRSASRDWSSPGRRDGYGGFRLAAVPRRREARR